MRGEENYEGGWSRSGLAPGRGASGDSNNGFVLPFNWNLLGEGTHTVRTLADGVEFDSATFTVTTLGTEFQRGAER